VVRGVGHVCFVFRAGDVIRPVALQVLDDRSSQTGLSWLNSKCKKLPKKRNKLL
jgi:hypothetical protein